MLSPHRASPLSSIVAAGSYGKAERKYHEAQQQQQKRRCCGMGKPTKQMKRLGLSNKAGPTKRAKQQPPIDSTAASSTCLPTPPSVSAVVLDNPDVLGLVASFLRLGKRADVQGQASTGTGTITVPPCWCDPVSTTRCSASRFAAAAPTRC